MASIDQRVLIDRYIWNIWKFDFWNATIQGYFWILNAGVETLFIFLFIFDRKLWETFACPKPDKTMTMEVENKIANRKIVVGHHPHHHPHLPLHLHQITVVVINDLYKCVFTLNTFLFYPLIPFICCDIVFIRESWISLTKVISILLWCRIKI